MSTHTVCHIKIWYFEDDHKNGFSPDELIPVATAAAKNAYDELVQQPWFEGMAAAVEEVCVALTHDAFLIEMNAVRERKQHYEDVDINEVRVAAA